MRHTHKYVELGRAVYQKINASMKGHDHASVLNMYHTSMKAVQAVDPKAQLFMFGSTVAFGFHEKGSDIDFVALDQADLRAHSAPDLFTDAFRLREITFLERMAEALQEQHPNYLIHIKRETRMPVLRVKGGAPMDIDITAHRRNSLRCTQLLRLYMDQFPLARWLCYAVKNWSKQMGIHSRCEGGSIKSHGINLLVTHYLLHRGLVHFVDPQSVRATDVQPLPVLGATPLLPRREEDLAALDHLFRDFLRYYLSEFNWEDDAVSLDRCSPGCSVFQNTSNSSSSCSTLHPVVPKTAFPKWKHLPWCILDPYDKEVNLGEKVTAETVAALREEIIPRTLQALPIAAAPLCCG